MKACRGCVCVSRRVCTGLVSTVSIRGEWSVVWDVRGTCSERRKGLDSWSLLGRCLFKRGWRTRYYERVVSNLVRRGRTTRQMLGWASRVLLEIFEVQSGSVDVVLIVLDSGVFLGLMEELMEFSMVVCATFKRLLDWVWRTLINFGCLKIMSILVVLILCGIGSSKQ